MPIARAVLVASTAPDLLILGDLGLRSLAHDEPIDLYEMDAPAH